MILFAMRWFLLLRDVSRDAAKRREMDDEFVDALNALLECVREIRGARAWARLWHRVAKLERQRRRWAQRAAAREAHGLVVERENRVEAERRCAENEEKLEAADALAALTADERDRACQERDAAASEAKRWESVAEAERKLRYAERRSVAAAPDANGKIDDELRANHDEADARSKLRALGVEP